MRNSLASTRGTSPGGGLAGEVVFVPGWGLEGSLWMPVQTVLARMPGLTCTILELGDTPGSLSAVSPHLAVGHSTGFLWLLRERPLLWDGLVAVNGFTRFVAGSDFAQGVEVRLLERMLRRFDQDPATVTTTFLHRCGMQEMSHMRRLDRLRQGLLWLRDWDVRPAFAAESVPRLVLAGGADPIVPPAMTWVCFGGQSGVEIIWQPEGGHLLPLSHPLWLAMHLWTFVQRLRGYVDQQT